MSLDLILIKLKNFLKKFFEIKFIIFLWFINFGIKLLIEFMN